MTKATPESIERRINEFLITFEVFDAVLQTSGLNKDVDMTNRIALFGIYSITDRSL